jgi:hypothetical protein
VSKRDRRGYFRFVPIQLAEGRPLVEQLGIDPDRPGSFAFFANGQAYVKSESRAAHCARASALAVDMGLPIHPTGDSATRSMTWSRATAIAGSAVVTLASRRIRIVRGHREPPRETAGRWRLALVGWAGMMKEAALLLFNSVPVTVSTIRRISFVCAQARIEAE